MEYKVISEKVIKAPPSGAAQNDSTRLAAPDKTSIAIATCRASFWKSQFNVDALEQAISLMLEDLPFLSGRIGSLKMPISWKMDDICIANVNAGVPFTVIDATKHTLEDLNADSWTMINVTISAPNVPFYIPYIETGPKLLKGQEPLCKINLTQLKNGSILGISLSHIITDGIHYPGLMIHFAARYRQVVSGKLCDIAELLPSDGLKSSLTVATMKEKLNLPDWKPQPFNVSAGFCDYWRAGSLLIGNARKKMDFEILYISRQDLAQLKADVLGFNSNGRINTSEVTTGDVVQALAALMIHAAEGVSLLPILPKCCISLLQIPGIDPVYFGNAVHPLAVGIPPETAAQLPTDPNSRDYYMATLATLAARIRACIKEVRDNPGKALQALYESEVVCSHPVHKALAFLAGHRLPYVTCTTNYIGSLPTDKTLDFGLGQQHACRWLVTPLAKDMSIIRPAMPPYEEGLFISAALSTQQITRLKSHPLLKSLFLQTGTSIRWVGGGGSK